MPQILILVPHDLALDPRVKWMSDSLTNFFEVTAIGIQQVDRGHGFDPKIHTIQLAQVRNNLVGVKALFKLFPLPIVLFLFLFFLFLTPLLVIAVLGKKGIKVALRYFPSIKKSPQTNNVLIEGISDFYLLIYLLKHFFTVLSCFACHFEKADSRPDYIFANDLDTLLPALYLKKKSGAKIIYDAHEFYPFQFPNSTRLLTKALEIIEKHILPHVDSMITVTPQLATVIKDYYDLDFDVFSIPNCAPIETKVPKDLKGSKEVVFLFQGVFARGRGIETLISFWSKLKPKNAILKLRGPQNEFRDECQKLAEDLQTLNDMIFFEQPVGEDLLIQMASEADVGVIPYEATSINNINCCPNKLSQYLQSGIAVLANDLPFVTEVLNKSGAGLVYNSKDISSFERSINQMISDSEKLLSFKNNARLYSEKEFNWDKVSLPVLNRIFGTR